MCRTSFFILWVACGHTSREDNRCENGRCLLEVPLFSREQHEVCETCTTDPSERLPLLQRGANHQQFQARIARQRAEYSAPLNLHASIAVEQQQIMAMEQERREEELALSEISSELMTITQARRIRFIHNGLVEISRGELDMTDVDRNRLTILRRAMFNIPARLMNDWRLEDLRIHSQRLIDDTTTRAELSRQAFTEFDAIMDSLSWDERRTRVSQLMNGRRDLNRDYATYFDLTHLITEREEQERALWQRSSRLSRRALAIERLLEPVSISSLPSDEFSQRCTICMETYGEVDEDGTVEIPSRLPCGHVYGTHCVSTWLLENDTCGVCRHNYSVELGSAPPPQLVAQEEQNFTDGEELPDYEEDVANEEDMGQIMQNPAPFRSVFPHNPAPQQNQAEFWSSGSDADNEEVETVNMDENPFMAWGLSSQEDLSLDADFDEDEIMRFLDEDQDMIPEDQGESR